MQDKLVQLLRACATDLPKDVESALLQARDVESGVAAEVLNTIVENIKLARNQGKPICQDTGTPVFYVSSPQTADREKIRKDISEAVRKATENVPLRPNAVDPITGLNSGDNTGVNVPLVLFSEWGQNKLRFDLMLKGGGSEYVTRLYKLPEPQLDAGRDLNGVRKCVLDAVHKAQGKGCPPYIIGVSIGGMADTALSLAKKQLLREIDDVNHENELAELEQDLFERINSLGIGPMGLGGKTTVLAVKAAKQHTHPASYFVGVSFMCWACRRASIEVKP